MSSKSFRDRYNNLARLAGVEERAESVLEEWPYPASGEVKSSGFGNYVYYENAYSDPSIARAKGLLESATDLPVESLIFLDTETTGLSGGTGTYVFLVGVGAFEGDGFVVRQFFMRHPGEEVGMLHATENSLADRRQLVTFNGKSFDLPLLVTRHRMYHRDFRMPPAHHDLLHDARFIWKHRLANCSLGTLEQQVLGVERKGDPPGWMIPGMYFDYLRTRNPSQIQPVLQHNSIDIVSLARLTAEVSAYQAAVHEPDDDIDRLAVTLWRMRKSANVAAVEQALECWNIRSAPVELRLRVLQEASARLKRIRQFEILASTWTAASTDPSRVIRLFAIEELAKYCEHHQRDFHEAHRLTTMALQSATLARDVRAIERFQHRLERLERKVGRRI